MCDPITLGIIGSAAGAIVGSGTGALAIGGLAGAAVGGLGGAYLGKQGKNALGNVLNPKQASGPAAPTPKQPGILPQSAGATTGPGTGSGFSAKGASSTLLTGARGAKVNDTLLGSTDLLGR